MGISRRTFLGKTLAAGALVIGGGPLTMSCSGVRRSDVMPSEVPIKTAPGLDEKGTAILHYASLAPSGHNAQPWYVKVVDEVDWIVGVDLERKLPVVDPENRETLLSIGAFVENLSIAAGILGYGAEMEIIAASPFDEEVIRVKLKGAKPTNYPLERLTTRMTVKKGFRPDELKGDDVRALSEPLKGRLFYFPRGTDHAKCIEEGAVEYFRVQSHRDDAQRELARWIRFSNKEARMYLDGLTTESMGITGFAGWYVRAFMNAENVLQKDFRERGIQKVEQQATEGGGWFIVTSEGSSVRDLIDTGRRFERMALLAKEQNVGVHPMTQWLEEGAGRQELNKNHPEKPIPQFVLRVGYVDPYPEPITLRRPVTLFVRT